MKRLDGKVALVSAATNGIGLACALELAESGAKVYLGARNEEKAKGIIEKNSKLDLNFSYFNSAEPETFRTFVENVIDKEGRLDILVNNYGTTDVNKDFDLENTEREDFFKILHDNLGSVYDACKAAVPIMKKNGGGSIINISSVGGIYPDMQRISYGVSKASINFLTKDIAVQYAKDNIRCNAVLPGYTETDAAKNNMSEEFLKAFLTTVPLNRPGHVEDLAKAVVFLASDDASYITGELLPVGGGFGLPTPMYPLYMMKGARG